MSQVLLLVFGTRFPPEMGAKGRLSTNNASTSKTAPTVFGEGPKRHFYCAWGPSFQRPDRFSASTTSRGI